MEDVNFSAASMLDVISMFYEILQCKVDCRCETYKTYAIGKLYDIRFNEIHFALTREGKKIDPFPFIATIGDNRYYLHLNYDGGDVIKHQPGNSCLRQLGENQAQPWAIYHVYNNTLNDDDHYILQNLLLCLEISRRKVLDPNRWREVKEPDGKISQIHGLTDKFCNLPILGAITIGLELMNDQIIKADEFFAGKYHCFSGENRESNIKKLLQIFCQHQDFQTIEQFLDKIQTLYKRFINLKINDRVLPLTEEINLTQPTKRRRLGSFANPKTMELIRKELIEHNKHTRETGTLNLHIVDVTDDENDFFYAMRQALHPGINFANVKPKGDLWEETMALRKFLCDSRDEKEKILFPFTKEDWAHWEQKLGYRLIVLDATSFDSAYIKAIGYQHDYDPQNPQVYTIACCNLRQISCDYQKKDILLCWCGNHWQTVLPISE